MLCLLEFHFGPIIVMVTLVGLNFRNISISAILIKKKRVSYVVFTSIAQKDSEIEITTEATLVKKRS